MTLKQSAKTVVTRSTASDPTTVCKDCGHRQHGAPTLPRLYTVNYPQRSEREETEIEIRK